MSKVFFFLFSFRDQLFSFPFPSPFFSFPRVVFSLCMSKAFLPLRNPLFKIAAWLSFPPCLGYKSFFWTVIFFFFSLSPQAPIPTAWGRAPPPPFLEYAAAHTTSKIALLSFPLNFRVRRVHLRIFNRVSSADFILKRCRISFPAHSFSSLPNVGRNSPLFHEGRPPSTYAGSLPLRGLPKSPATGG